jgi:hypothetical protein
VKQLKEGTFISQAKYTQDLLKRFGMKDAKPAKTPMGTDGHLDLNKGGKSIDQKAYQSTIGSLLYLCASSPDIMLSVCMCARFQSDPKECHLVDVKRILRYLVSTPCFRIWYPKGSTFDLIGYSNSDYLSKVPLLCDNESAICLADNPVEHSRTKHIDIWHHFLRDHQQRGDIDIYHISTENQLADIFTKPLDEKRFCRLRTELNVLDLCNLD